MGVWNIREVKYQKVQITVHKEAREILKIMKFTILDREFKNLEKQHENR